MFRAVSLVDLFYKISFVWEFRFSNSCQIFLVYLARILAVLDAQIKHSKIHEIFHQKQLERHTTKPQSSINISQILKEQTRSRVTTIFLIHDTQYITKEKPSHHAQASPSLTSTTKAFNTIDCYNSSN